MVFGGDARGKLRVGVLASALGYGVLVSWLASCGGETSPGSDAGASSNGGAPGLGGSGAIPASGGAPGSGGAGFGGAPGVGGAIWVFGGASGGLGMGGARGGSAGAFAGRGGAQSTGGGGGRAGADAGGKAGGASIGGGAGGRGGGGNAGRAGSAGGGVSGGGGASGAAGAITGGSSVGGVGPLPGFKCFLSATCDAGERCVSCTTSSASEARCVPDPNSDPSGYVAATNDCLAIPTYGDCDGPEDCPPGKYCAYTAEVSSRAHCVAESALPTPARATCCFTCDSMPVCTLCWNDSDCPAAQTCKPIPASPQSVGGCK